MKLICVFVFIYAKKKRFLTTQLIYTCPQNGHMAFLFIKRYTCGGMRSEKDKRQEIQYLIYLKVLNSWTPHVSLITLKCQPNLAFFCGVMPPKDADRMANSLDLDQTFPQSSLIWFNTANRVRTDLEKSLN